MKHRYRKLTPQQRAVYLAIRQLGGEIVVTPDTARPLHALKRRGLVRFARDEAGVKLARLRLTAPQKRVRARMARWDTSYNGLNATGWIPTCEPLTRE